MNWSYNGMGGSSTLHWDQIIPDCKKYNVFLTPANTPQSLNEVSHLCRDTLEMLLELNIKRVQLVLEKIRPLIGLINGES